MFWVVSDIRIVAQAACSPLLFWVDQRDERLHYPFRGFLIMTNQKPYRNCSFL